MKLSFLFFLIFTGLAIGACNRLPVMRESELFGSWKLADVKPLKDKNLSLDQELLVRERISNGELLSLFGDHTFTHLSGESVYKFGNWSYPVNTGILSVGDKNATLLDGYVRFQNDAAGSRYLVVNEKGTDYELVYSMEAEPRANPQDNAYHQANNEWRLRGGENRMQLKKKVANYVKHLALIFKAAAEDKKDAIAFMYSTGPIHFYRGGIGVVSYDMVSGEWKSTFSSDEKAAEAYRIYEAAVSDGDYKGAGTGNWVMDNSNILFSIYSKLSK